MTNNQPSPDSKAKSRWRLRLQFSLQTMLLLTLIAALLSALLLAPRLREKPVAGGALKIRAAWPESQLAPNATVPDSESPALTGRWLLYDGYGGKRIDGHLANGVPAGHWRYYDQRRRELLAGDLWHGQLDNTWTARDTNGQVVHQLDYDQVETVLRGPSWDGTGHEQPVWLPVRSGPVQQNWPNGQPRARGQFRADRYEGAWTYFDQEGRKTEEGTFRDGKKHGTWRRWKAAGTVPVTELFAAGKRVDNPDALLAQLADDLLGDDPVRQVRAARRLEPFGHEALPALRAALRDGDRRRQLLAIRTLKHLGPEAAAAAPDLEILGRGDPAQVQMSALVALAEIKPERAREIFEQLLILPGEELSAERDLKIECLAQAGPAGLEQLTRQIDSPQPAVRLAAFDVVARMYVIHYFGSPARRDPNLDPHLIKVAISVSQLSDSQVAERLELFQRMQWKWSSRRNIAGSGGMF